MSRILDSYSQYDFESVDGIERILNNLKKWEKEYGSLIFDWKLQSYSDSYELVVERPENEKERNARLEKDAKAAEAWTKTQIQNLEKLGYKVTK